MPNFRQILNQAKEFRNSISERLPEASDISINPQDLFKRAEPFLNVLSKAKEKVLQTREQIRAVPLLINPADMFRNVIREREKLNETKLNEITLLRQAIGSQETSRLWGAEKRYSNRKQRDSKFGDVLGKYHVSEAELKDYSERYFGRKLTSKEFLNNSQIQDAYMDGKIKYWLNQGRSIDDIIGLHRGGIQSNNEDYRLYIDAVKKELQRIKSMSMPASFNQI